MLEPSLVILFQIRSARVAVAQFNVLEEAGVGEEGGGIAVGSWQWAVGSGQLAVGSGQWAVGPVSKREQWAVHSI